MTIELKWWQAVMITLVVTGTSFFGGAVIAVLATWDAAKAYTVEQIRLEILDELASGRGSFKVQGIETLEFYPRLADKNRASKMVGCRLAGAVDEHFQPKKICPDGVSDRNTREAHDVQ